MEKRCVVWTTTAAAVAAVITIGTTTLSAQGRGGGNAAAAQAAAAVPTPRDANGHPDLNGMWNGTAGGGGVNNGSGVTDSGDVVNLLTGRSSDGGVLGQAAVNFEQDNTLIRRMDPNIPQYKPEFWDRVQKLDRNGNKEDPEYMCLPQGVPRMGAPMKIVQLPRETILFYTGQRDVYRVVPTDGRAHTPDADLEGTWMGEPLGHWDGDTFVVDSTGFGDSSWLGIAGWFHSENMHVIETFKREGNTLTYQATVEDLDVLMKPFKYAPRRLLLNTDPKAVPLESLPCFERDLSHLVTNEHH